MDDLNKKINTIIWIAAVGIAFLVWFGMQFLNRAGVANSAMYAVAIAVIIIVMVIASYLTYGNKKKVEVRSDVLYFKNCPKCRYDTISDSENIRICTNCGDDLSYIKPLRK